MRFLDNGQSNLFKDTKGVDVFDSVYREREYGHVYASNRSFSPSETRSSCNLYDSYRNSGLPSGVRFKRFNSIATDGVTNILLTYIKLEFKK